MENKLEVELINAQLLDFTTQDGVVKGVKICFLDSSKKENQLNGNYCEAFFNYEKMPNYEEMYRQLSNHYINCRKNGVVPMITICYTYKSIKQPPVITNFEIKGSK